MPDLTSVARWVMIFGLGLFSLGGLLWLLGRAGLPMGRLPGDLQFQRGNLTCFLPLATSILLSLALTVAVNLIARILK